jgi:PncC family amidohydrolase
MHEVLTTQVAQLLTEHQLTLALAEASTGGLIVAQLTSIAGSSAYLKGCVVVYSHESKTQIIGVPLPTLIEHGTVSAETALALAHGARKIFDADIGLAETGITGPSGGTPEKPVGLAFIALAAADYETVERYVWSHDRAGNRQATVEAALQLLQKYLSQSESRKKKETMGTPIFPTRVTADMLPDGTMHPQIFVWQGKQLSVASVGRQWVEGERRHILVMTANHEAFELIGAVNWSVTKISSSSQFA